MEVSARVPLKIATRASFRDKKPWKFRFVGYFSEAKMQESDQKS